MKFAQKLTLAIVALLCLTLSAGGAWTITQNFSHSLAQALERNTTLHLRERYALEAALEQAGDGALSSVAGAAQRYAAGLAGAAGTEGFRFSVYCGEGTSVYSSMPKELSFASQRKAIQAGEGAGVYCAAGKARWLLLASPLQGRPEELWLVSCYDVTPYFAERTRQLQQFFLLECVALALAGAAAAGISGLLTRPLRQLEAASRQIAAGDYGGRVPVRGKDEIARLSGSFNAMAQAVQEQVEALRREAERQTRFAAAFTHELKTPMTSIYGYADLLRSGELPAEKRQRAANYIYHESARLETLSRQLLALLGLQKGGVALGRVQVAAVFSAVQRSLADLPARLETDYPPDAAAAAEPALLADLLRNLVLNAAAAAPVDGRVRLRCVPCEAGWRLLVEDKGRGIPAEELDKVLEPFYRVDKARARQDGGNGLGLSLCAEIARAHGSALHIESREGEGTRVWLELPACPMEVEA